MRITFETMDGDDESASAERCPACRHAPHSSPLGCLVGRVWKAFAFSETIIDVYGMFRGGCFCKHGTVDDPLVATDEGVIDPVLPSVDIAF